MPPKKREKEPEGPKAPQTYLMPADTELFYQAYEKPSQIYRLLSARSQISPIFLFRNLSYMRYRMSRSHKSRQNFKIDSMYEKKMQQLSIQRELIAANRRYMNLTFIGFFDKRIEESQDNSVQVETILLTICHKKRKDVRSFMQVSVGTNDVQINPSDNNSQPKSTIKIPNELFIINNGHVMETYMLLLRVYYTPKTNHLLHNCDTEEPAQKRRKTINGVVPIKLGIEETKSYSSELVVYDKHNRCLLTDGNYELSLQEIQSNLRTSPKKQSFWETIPHISDDNEGFEHFNKNPTLKFRLTWINETEGNVENKIVNSDNKENQPRNSETKNERFSSYNGSNNNNNGPLATALLNRKKTVTGKTDGNIPEIVYQFLYSNNSRQQTKPCADVHCPFCRINCYSLYVLLKHLKLYHLRFIFTYVPMAEGVRIDVALNEWFDGSYAGSPHELIHQPYEAEFLRDGPTRRTSVTNILVCRPKRVKPSLSEFLEPDENDYESQRPYIIGHNRLYHHTVTCLPIYPKEMDIDSEGENDPKWLRTKTVMMIDEFTDVNEGEKELMTMWNLHVMKYGYVGDCQVPLACQMFLEYNGKEILKKNLYRNFVLHLSCLFDYGLIGPLVLYQNVQKLQEMMREEGEQGDLRRVLQNSHHSQVKHWTVNGVLPNIKKEPPITMNLMKNLGSPKLNSTRNSLNKTSEQNGTTNRRKSSNESITHRRRKAGENSENGISPNGITHNKKKFLLDMMHEVYDNQKKSVLQ